MFSVVENTSESESKIDKDISVLLRILLNQNWKLTEMFSIAENTSE